jgi:hypothetical protein
VIKFKVVGEQDGIYIVGVDEPKRPDVVKRNTERQTRTVKNKQVPNGKRKVINTLDESLVMACWNYLEVTHNFYYADEALDQMVADHLNEKLKTKERKKAQIKVSAIRAIRKKLQTKDDPYSDPRYE